MRLTHHCNLTENCRAPSDAPSLNIIKRIRHAAHSYGRITLFKAYTEVTSIKPSVRSDLQLSGVSLVDCPHNGKKEVVDKMMTGACHVYCSTSMGIKDSNDSGYDGECYGQSGTRDCDSHNRRSRLRICHIRSENEKISCRCHRASQSP
jgi:hypothetical protein